MESDSGHGNVRFSGGNRLKSKQGNVPSSSVNEGGVHEPEEDGPDASRSACHGDG